MWFSNGPDHLETKQNVLDHWKTKLQNVQFSIVGYSSPNCSESRSWITYFVIEFPAVLIDSGSRTLPPTWIRVSLNRMSHFESSAWKQSDVSLISAKGCDTKVANIKRFWKCTMINFLFSMGEPRSKVVLDVPVRILAGHVFSLGLTHSLIAWVKLLI